MRTPSEGSQQNATISHSMQRFVNPKKFVMLTFFALVCANAVTFTANHLAQKQIFTTARSTHIKIFNSYEDLVLKQRATLAINQPVTSVSPPASSFWWAALKEIRQQNPLLKIQITLASHTQISSEQKIFEILKNKPRGYTAFDESEGWARSVFLLPTKNTAAFSVLSYIRDDLNQWRDTAVALGGVVFLLFMFLGWFWTRAQDIFDIEDTSISQPTQQMDPDVQEYLREKITNITKTMGEMGQIITKIKTSMHNLEQKSRGAQESALCSLEDIINQIHLMAINGAIESSRTQETNQAFHALMQEINQLSLRSKRVITNLKQSDATSMQDLKDDLASFEKVLSKLAS